MSIRKPFSAKPRLDGYQAVRAKVAKGILRMKKLGRKLKIPQDYTSAPPRAAGGIIINQNVFMAITTDSTYGGIERQLIYDAINQVIGGLEEQKETEKKHLVNPLHWIRIVFLFILRLPFNLIKLSGFDVKKFEEHFWGKFVQLLWLISLIGILIALGVKWDEIAKMVIEKFAK